MTDYADLIARLEAASGPDHKLNAAVHEAFGLPFVMEYWAEYSIEPTRNLSMVPLYTASIDAAIALVEKVLPEYEAEIYIGKTLSVCGLWKDYGQPDGMSMDWEETGPTAPLAILAALLRAKLAGGPMPDRERARGDCAC